MNEELKPCPFCGGEAHKESFDVLITIGCEKCKYKMGFPGIVQKKINTGVSAGNGYWYDKDAHVKANAAWNRRATND